MLERADAKRAKLSRPREPKRLPEVLSASAEEVEAIIEAAPSRGPRPGTGPQGSGRRPVADRWPEVPPSAFRRSAIVT